MGKYAGKEKRAKDIGKDLKKEKSAKKTNEKKAELKKLFYYAKLQSKNKKW